MSEGYFIKDGEKVLSEELISEPRVPEREIGESGGSTFQTERMADSRTLRREWIWYAQRIALLPKWLEWRGLGQSGQCERSSEINEALWLQNGAWILFQTWQVGSYRNVSKRELLQYNLCFWRFFHLLGGEEKPVRDL